MSNLLAEYIKRHKSTSIPVCHNGVCFFDNQEKPAMIALTSLSCRPFSTCPNCDNQGVIVELFVPGYMGSFYLIAHEHIEPDTDLMRIIFKYTHSNNVKPHFAKSGVELDAWLWKFITHDISMKNFKSVESMPELKMVEQMSWAAFKQPKTYANYFIAYEALLLNRKYLLHEED